MILQGVKIGKNCLVGGGSVVTKSIPDGCMVAGNPVKFIGHTDAFYRRVKETNNVHCFKVSLSEKENIFCLFQMNVFHGNPILNYLNNEQATHHYREFVFGIGYSTVVSQNYTHSGESATPTTVSI